LPEHRSIAGLLRKSSGRLTPSHKTFRRTILPRGWVDHSIHVKRSVVEEAYTLGTSFIVLLSQYIVSPPSLHSPKKVSRLVRLNAHSFRAIVDTLPVQGQKFRPSVRYVTRWVCRTQISRCLHDYTANHLGPVKGEFEGRRGGQLIWYTLDFHHLSSG